MHGLWLFVFGSWVLSLLKLKLRVEKFPENPTCGIEMMKSYCEWVRSVVRCLFLLDTF